MSILAFLSEEGRLRYITLKKKLPGISEKMLSTQLKELQAAKLVQRTAYAAVPPIVEYELTEKGKSLNPILAQMAAWGDIHMNEK